MVDKVYLHKIVANRMEASGRSIVSTKGAVTNDERNKKINQPVIQKQQTEKNGMITLMRTRSQTYAQNSNSTKQIQKKRCRGKQVKILKPNKPVHRPGGNQITMETDTIITHPEEMRDEGRWETVWRCDNGRDIGSVWYKDYDSVQRHRYDIKRSTLLDTVVPEEEKHLDDMLGVYATREYKKGDIITVYSGDNIGEANGEKDDYKGYHRMNTLEQERAERLKKGQASGHGARHVMQIGKRLCDGYKGYTGAQYINAYYNKPKGWRKNSKINNEGVIRATVNIKIGEEILYVYGKAYWDRWHGKRVTQKQDNTRKKRTKTQGLSTHTKKQCISEHNMVDTWMMGSHTTRTQKEQKKYKQECSKRKKNINDMRKKISREQPQQHRDKPAQIPNTNEGDSQYRVLQNNSVQLDNPEPMQVEQTDNSEPMQDEIECLPRGQKRDRCSQAEEAGGNWKKK